MDFQNEFEQELVFKIETKNKEEKQNNKQQKKVIRLASTNLRKLVMIKLGGKTGEC